MLQSEAVIILHDALKKFYNQPAQMLRQEIFENTCIVGSAGKSFPF